MRSDFQKPSVIGRELEPRYGWQGANRGRDLCHVLLGVALDESDHRFEGDAHVVTCVAGSSAADVDLRVFRYGDGNYLGQFLGEVIYCLIHTCTSWWGREDLETTGA
jgi:hypothetical protein